MIIKKELQPVDDSLQSQQSIDTNSNKQKNNSSISSEMSLICVTILLIISLILMHSYSGNDEQQREDLKRKYESNKSARAHERTMKTINIEHLCTMQEIENRNYVKAQENERLREEVEKLKMQNDQIERDIDKRGGGIKMKNLVGKQDRLQMQDEGDIA